MTDTITRRAALATFGTGAVIAGTAGVVPALGSVDAEAVSTLVDGPDLGPLASEVLGMAREARDHTFMLAKILVLADEYERGGPAEPLIEACAEYAEQPRWGAYRVMRLVHNGSERQGGLLS
jgi:hypothetical protein